MFNVGLFELIFFLSFALIFLGPEKLLELVKSAYQIYRKLKLMFHNIQSDLERELKLNELQQTLESEINKVKDLEKLLSQKIYADLESNHIVYSLMPYSSLDKIQSITSFDLSIQKQILIPFSYDTYNRVFNANISFDLEKSA